jgi:hypothetical protein
MCVNRKFLMPTSLVGMNLPHAYERQSNLNFGEANGGLKLKAPKVKGSVEGSAVNSPKVKGSNENRSQLDRKGEGLYGETIHRR